MPMKKFWPRLAIVLSLLIFSVGCDQATKEIATAELADRPPIEMLSGMFRLTYAENPGAMLSLGADLPDEARLWIFQGGVGLMLLLMLLFVLLRTDLDRLQVVALSLFLGGGIGNLIDRVASGAVVDFMILGKGWLKTGVFNVADIAIMLGALLFIISAIKKKPPAEAEAPPPAQA